MSDPVRIGERDDDSSRILIDLFLPDAGGCRALGGGFPDAPESSGVAGIFPFERRQAEPQIRFRVPEQIPFSEQSRNTAGGIAESELLGFQNCMRKTRMHRQFEEGFPVGCDAVSGVECSDGPQKFCRL